MPDGSSFGDSKQPETPITLPSDERKLISRVIDLVSQCRVTSGQRAAYYRQLAAWTETGRQDGSKSKLNLLFNHLDRLASYLFSPVGLKFAIEYRYDYPGEMLKRARVAASTLTDDWEMSSTDMTFGQGVFNSLQFGAALLKQWPQRSGEGFVHQKSLVMPWNFGVYAEYINDLDRQPAMCETVTLTLPEVWNLVQGMPGDKELFSRIRKHAASGSSAGSPESVFHQVLSTATLQVGNMQPQRPTPGGIIQLNTDANYSIMTPTTAVETVLMHELFVWDGEGRTTIQFIEPDIMILPRSRRYNVLAHDPMSGATADDLRAAHPYTLIQPNPKHGYFWGRSELEDLMEIQGWISDTCNDLGRIMNLQFDRIYAFGGEGLNDEEYDQMRGAGYFNTGQGGDVKDLTPPFPPEGMPFLDKLINYMEMIGGMDNLLSGRGEPGVRAGNHAEMLMKTASPRMRDRALLVERQCAMAADFWLRVLEAKDPRHYWTDGKTLESQLATQFLLTDLPDDRRVVVDSHSASPVFQDDHAQLITWGMRHGVTDADYAVDHLPFPDKDTLHHGIRTRAEAQQKMLADLKQHDPEAFAKVVEKGAGGAKHR